MGTMRNLSIAEVNAVSGGNMVTVTVNGKSVDPEFANFIVGPIFLFIGGIFSIIGTTFWQIGTAIPGSKYH